MTKRSPLAPGMKIKFVGGFGAGICFTPYRATITSISPNHGDPIIAIRTDAGETGQIARRQVVSRLIPKPRKEKQERVQFWADVTRSGKSCDLPEEPPGDEPLALPGNRWVHLVELREGETICPPGSVSVSREKLAEAWNKTFHGHIHVANAPRGAFYMDMLHHLGLPKEGA